MTADTINFCYDMRGLRFGEIKSRSKDAQDEFDKLVHYIRRVGATRSHAHAVQGDEQGSGSSSNILIWTVELPDMRKVMMDQGAVSPYETVRKSCMDSTSQDLLQNEGTAPTCGTSPNFWIRQRACGFDFAEYYHHEYTCRTADRGGIH